jgi:hypothetical protein
MLVHGTEMQWRLTVTGYHPMTLAELARRLARTPYAKMRWKLVWEFLEEYRWEQARAQSSLLQEEPVGDERWDALLTALAEHLAAQLDLAPPPHRSLDAAAPLKPLPQPVVLEQYRVRRPTRVSGTIHEYRLVA